MGYYTNYDLSYELPEETDNSTQELEEFTERAKELNIIIPEGLTINRQSLVNQLDEALDEDTEYGPYRDFLGGYNVACKWYNHETEMKCLSEKFSTVLFILKGKGEEAGDLWIKYFKHGKMQVCKVIITYDPFDEGKLK